jgi:hypothetical protein
VVGFSGLCQNLRSQLFRPLDHLDQVVAPRINARLIRLAALALQRNQTDAIVEDVIVPKAACFTRSTPKHLSDIDDALQHRVGLLVNID